MLILQIESPSPYFQGDQVYRTFQPCFALAESGDACVIAGTWLSPLVQEAVYVADVVVLCQVAWYDFLPILQARKRAGLATIFEVNDNFLALQAWNTAAGFYNDPSNRALTRQLAYDADGMMLCSPGLVRRFSHLNKHLCVLPNQLWDKPHKKTRPEGPVCVGWAGSGGHREDIRWVAPALIDMLHRHPDVTLAIMAQEEVHAMFEGAPKERLRLSLPGSLSEYQSFLRSLDVGIAPLLPTPFNQCRSDVKYLEYAAAGAVPVCSRAEPYAETVVHGRNGMLFDDLAGLGRALDKLVADAPLRRELGDAALQDVQRHRLERNHIAPRRDFYRSCLKTPSGDVTRAADRVRALFKKYPTPTYRPHANFWQLRLDHAEAALLTVTLDEGKDEKKLYENMNAAVTLAPDAYLPHVYYGRHHKSYGKGVRALEKAMALNPSSCLAPFLLGQVHLRVGAAAPALAAFQRTVELAPKFAPAHEALARLALDAGREDAAAEHLGSALRANPFYRTPAMHLARMHLAKGDIDAADKLLTQSINLGDPEWRDYFLLADVHQRRRDWPQACAAIETARAMAPAEEVLRARLAQLYLLSGKVTEARRVLKQAPCAPAT